MEEVILCGEAEEERGTVKEGNARLSLKQGLWFFVEYCQASANSFE